jgi:hypothetical protein
MVAGAAARRGDDHEVKKGTGNGSRRCCCGHRNLCSARFLQEYSIAQERCREHGSNSLHRWGGPEWDKWNADTRLTLIKLQNEDGTWAGQHCISGRVAVTRAILLLMAERDMVSTPVAPKRELGII